MYERNYGYVLCERNFQSDENWYVSVAKSIRNVTGSRANEWLEWCSMSCEACNIVSCANTTKEKKMNKSECAILLITLLLLGEAVGWHKPILSGWSEWNWKCGKCLILMAIHHDSVVDIYYTNLIRDYYALEVRRSCRYYFEESKRSCFHSCNQWYCCM